jgi:hypothetical protein
MFLHRAQSKLVALERLRVPWIFNNLFLGGQLRCHQKPSFPVEIELPLPGIAVAKKSNDAGSLDAKHFIQVDRLPIAFDDARPNLPWRFALFVHGVSVVKLLHASGALRAMHA